MQNATDELRLTTGEEVFVNFKKALKILPELLCKTKGWKKLRKVRRHGSQDEEV